MRRVLAVLCIAVLVGVFGLGCSSEETSTPLADTGGADMGVTDTGTPIDSGGATDTGATDTGAAIDTGPGADTGAAMDTGGTTDAAPATHDINVADSMFTPNTITIKAGDTVKWTWSGSLPHSVTSGTSCTSDGKFDSTIKTGTGNTFSHTFTTKGAFPYFCQVHCATGMTGTVTVE